MKLIILVCLVAAVAAAPLTKVTYPAESRILRFENEIGPSGYSYAYEQSDGSKSEQKGQVRNAGSENESLAVIGSFSWVGPDGVTYIVNYTADEEGYKPEIEQGPGGGVPPAVVASLLG